MIIDDASHDPRDQWLSFINLRSKLKHGGTYVIEDICNEELFRLLSVGVEFGYYDTRSTHQHDDLCAVFTRI